MKINLHQNQVKEGDNGGQCFLFLWTGRFTSICRPLAESNISSAITLLAQPRCLRHYVTALQRQNPALIKQLHCRPGMHAQLVCDFNSCLTVMVYVFPAYDGVTGRFYARAEVVSQLLCNIHRTVLPAVQPMATVR